MHFAATNPALAFDREAATGMRLAIHAGTSVRFEPGVEKDVTLVALGGSGTVPGLRLDVDYRRAGRAGPRGAAGRWAARPTPSCSARRRATGSGSRTPT